jgi:hypothetical protein
VTLGISVFIFGNVGWLAFIFLPFLSLVPENNLKYVLSRIRVTLDRGFGLDIEFIDHF